MQKRGQVTERIKKKAKELLGYSEISKDELRLMPYILYVMQNKQRIDPNKLNSKDRIVLTKWKEKGYIEGGAAGLGITKEFWDICCELVFLAYVDID